MRAVLMIFLLAAAAWAQEPDALRPAAPDVIALNDAALGTVTFQHKLHEERAEGRCDTCHHASKPEKEEARPYQACRDCHTQQLQPGVKTSRQAAFHSPPAQNGTLPQAASRFGEKAAAEVFRLPQKGRESGHRRMARAPAAVSARMAGHAGAAVFIIPPNRAAQLASLTP
ncbi:MAG: hypothetical protein KatS3mg005_2173 [Bryobacteraceae bacterium]|nr:MAG: hypothetical protein KatS3mg005_2173 [Bryobacteraceae bacterium]